MSARRQLSLLAGCTGLRVLLRTVLIPMGEAFRFGHMYEFFKDRRPGTLIPEAVDGCKLSTATGIAWLEAQLGDGRDWLCGERFSLSNTPNTPKKCQPAAGVSI